MYQCRSIDRNEAHAISLLDIYAFCLIVVNLQSTQKENTRELKFPGQTHLKAPKKRHWQTEDSDICNDIKNTA